MKTATLAQTPTEPDPVDSITAEEVLGQLARRSRNPGTTFPALLCQSEEAREETRQEGIKALEAYKEHERYLRTLRKVNPRAFFFEG